MQQQFDRLWVARRRALLSGTAFAGMVLAGLSALALPGFSSAAYAACGPAAASSVTANCTGVTDNQGAGAPGTSADPSGYGYGTGVESNLTVNVAPGANVTGTNQGIIADSLI